MKYLQQYEIYEKVMGQKIKLIADRSTFYLGKYYNKKEMTKILSQIMYNLGLIEKEAEFLGGGDWGYAFKVGNKVIKLTRDEQEFVNANRLRKKHCIYS